MTIMHYYQCVQVSTMVIIISAISDSDPQRLKNAEFSECGGDTKD